MLLTVSKRLEFSASRRLFLPRWTESENEIAFGAEARAHYGTGRNYIAYFIFTGPVDATTGMLINISEIKLRAGKILEDCFDHKFLNEDNAAFRERPPTAENIARELYVDLAPRFSDVDAQLVACHLIESPDRSATYFSDGACEANYWFAFSAARKTFSPQLSAQENEKLFGEAVKMHGHNYRARLTFRAETPPKEAPFVRHDEISVCIHSLRSELDHRFLNDDVASMKDRPMTTESLAEYIYERVNAVLPLSRVRLHERDDFFAEVWEDESMFLGMQIAFSAAHRLHVASFSSEENIERFGKCNNPRGHGHRYLAEATVGGKYDERTGTLYDFVALQNAMSDALEPWQDKHLDLETEDFRDMPSTGENIVRALWPKIDNRVNQQLVRLRLWETNNNRFTLRRT
ncbi:MAG: 6-pyruvoyltetrahydropterin/6-carboxytetrahydropterin synthase [Verrucomicrobiota bacterium]|jgi:6-pyruvoyltetrahydropterin/6-carboxytetrahydropterin synthase